ncbi:phosphotransferase family protein [Sorangium sp. So ce385]|uniref:phosphotransferase family protein n=1 Tax=Sorangium sp. So ce385 TaxID=3133308 RepID=UPI003F5BE335
MATVLAPSACWRRVGGPPLAAPPRAVVRGGREVAARDAGPGWAHAKRAIEVAFSSSGRPRIGRVRKVGHGLSNEVYAAHVELVPDPEGRSGTYAAFVPARGSTPRTRASWQREAALLARVAAGTRAIRVPALTAIVPVDGVDIVVRPYLEGIPLDLRAGRQGGVAPWDVVAQVAATVHAVDADGIPGIEGHATRRAHATSEISALHGVPELREAERWALDHLPEEEAAALIHGDLLGQNILLHGEQPYAVIDWEYATRGDPAYDMAIVTRGSARPFQIGHGLRRLLDAYAAQGRPRIEAAAVHLYELCLVGRWYRNAIDGMGDGGGEPPDQLLRRVENVFRRARAASGGHGQL